MHKHTRWRFRVRDNNIIINIFISTNKAYTLAHFKQFHVKLLCPTAFKRDEKKIYNLYKVCLWNFYE